MGLRSRQLLSRSGRADHASGKPFLRQRAIGRRGRAAVVDREIAGAGKNRARLQSVEAADRVAEMGGVGIADVLREVGGIDVLVGEMQQMPRPLPGPERTERDS